MNAIKLAFATGRFEGHCVDIVYREETEYRIYKKELWRQYECKNGKPLLVINRGGDCTIYGESIPY